MDIKPPLFGAELAEPVVMSKSSPLQQRKYRGFIAGIFSGAAKLTVGHPFDTIKVRMQTSTSTTFRTPLDCVVQTIRKEGVRGLYKGATPPLAGWMMMDSVMLGSLAVYRNFLHRTLFSPTRSSPFNSRNLDLIQSPESKLPVVGHGLAGILAGITVSFVAAPVEHLKARLQVQYSPIKASRFYQGPIDCMQKIVRSHGIPGLYHGLTATLIFRSFFFFWWSTYEIFTLQLRQRTTLSTPAINFWAGGLSAQVFWVCSYPSDVVKQRIMTDPLGGTLKDGVRKYKNWRQAAASVYKEAGWKGYWRGFLPCFLRAFPANACALVVFEAVMRTLP